MAPPGYSSEKAKVIGDDDKGLLLLVTNRASFDVQLGFAVPAEAATSASSTAHRVPAQSTKHALSLNLGAHVPETKASTSRARDLIVHLEKVKERTKETGYCGQASLRLPGQITRDRSTQTPWVHVDLQTTQSYVSTPEKHASGTRTPVIVLFQGLSHNKGNILIVPRRTPVNFLSELSNDASLAALCLPGTHESLALYGWPVSTCQSLAATIAKQLNDGIRYFDIRLVPKGEKGQKRLLAYHGITNERIEFEEVLHQCWSFLDSPEGQRETIIMSLKQESGDQPIFIRTLFESYVKATSLVDKRSPERWFLENRVPRLGEVRGRIVMLSRFVIDGSYGYPGGISPPIWPNSFRGVFEYTLPSQQLIKTQDWYDIGSLKSLSAKSALIRLLCEEGGCDSMCLALNYCNGSSFPLALPPAVAKGFLGTKGNCSKAAHGTTWSASLGVAVDGINVRLRDYVATLLHGSATIASRANPPYRSHHLPRQAIEGLRVTFALDYYDFVPDLVPLLIEANYG